MDSIVGQIVDRVVAAQDRRAAADVPGAGRPFDPSRGVPLDTLANSATAGFDVHPPLPTLSQEGLPKAAKGCASSGPATTSLPPRPNYQRDHARARIVVTDLEQSGKTAFPGLQRDVPTPSRVDVALRKMSVSSVARAAAQEATASGCGRGSRRCGACPWCASSSRAEVCMVENPDRRTCALLGIPCESGEAVLVASASRCSLSQLFVINALAGDLEGLRVDLDWRDGGAGEFSFICRWDAERLRKLETALRSALAGRGPWLVDEPSELLRRRLHIPSGPVLGVEGRSPRSLSDVLDALWKSSEESTIEASGCCGGTVVVGSADELARLRDFVSSNLQE